MQFKQLIDDIIIDFNFLKILQVWRIEEEDVINPMVDLSKFIYNKNILSKVVA